MRILVGMPETGARGGPAACEPPFIQELRRLGHEVGEEVYAYAETQSNLIKRIPRVLRTTKRFRERVQATNFDVVHINTSFDTMALLRDVVIVGMIPSRTSAIFLKFHGSDAQLLETRDPFLRFLWRYLFSRADGIGVLSSEERQNFLRAGLAEKKLFVVKNVVEQKPQSPDPTFTARLNVPRNVPLLLFIGRFIVAKGLIDVIRACKLLRDRKREFMLLCVGDGPTRREAEGEVERSNLRDQVRFFGYIPEAETAAFYANSTVLLFPTYHYEGFPMVIFNATAAGLPIITTRIRAAADHLQERKNCLWVESKRPDLLADRIIEVLGDSELRATMSTSNKQLAARFSREVVTREYVEAYERARVSHLS